jgi:hypothetical protein
MRKIILLLAVLSLALVALAGCGSEDEAASGASELVPARAAFYGEVTLEPEGDQKEAVDSILSKFPGGGDAGEKLKDLIEKGLRESDAPISFKEDIEPWLGDEAAFFGTGVNAAGSFQAGAALVATDDEDASIEALEKSAEGELRRQDYKGTEILRDQSDEAAAVLDGFLVLGSEQGVKAVIDTAEDGSPLSEDEQYKNSIEDAAEDRLGLVYVNSEEFAKSIEEGGIPLPDSAERFFDEPTVATIDADDDGVTVEGSAPEDFARAGFLGQASELLPELPADSWLALAQTDFGNLIDFYLDFAGAAVGGRDALKRQFQAATGLDLERDVLAWMGDFAIFARGASTSDLDGALIVETSDEAASGRFLEALERISRTQSGGPFRVGPLTLPGGGEGFTVTGTPKPIHSFQRNGRVVFAYGDAAAQDAVDPSETLGDSAEFGAVRDSLEGAEVSVYVLMQPIFDLVDSTESGSDADWQDAKPYLEPLSAIVSGSSGDGEDLRYLLKLIVE